MRNREGLTVWTVTTIQGETVEAWPVSTSAEEAFGVAIFALRELLGEKWIMRPPVLLSEESAEKWRLTGEPTVHGYPDIQPVEAYILRTSISEEA